MATWKSSEHSWDRQPKEGTKAYDAFQIYLSMGADRSLRKVAQRLSKSETLLKRWSVTWSWGQRVRDYEDFRTKQEFVANQKALKRMREKHIKIAEMMEKKAIDALDHVPPEEILPKEIIQMLKEAIRIEKDTREAISPAPDATGEGGSASGSLAESIIEAYRKRMEGGNGEDA